MAGAGSVATTTLAGGTPGGVTIVKVVNAADLI
jgi:hypothetical protein